MNSWDIFLLPEAFGHFRAISIITGIAKYIMQKKEYKLRGVLKNGWHEVTNKMKNSDLRE